jgi:hypothetical protein
MKREIATTFEPVKTALDQRAQRGDKMVRPVEEPVEEVRVCCTVDL